MARKEITTPLDLKNLDNHNYNYNELYGLIDETDRRISEDMWEEIKSANTMKMLEPVQRAADLPSEAADKSLITVIDEQRVYSFVNGEWQPFNQIDLDPFEPFKDELSEIVAAYEKQIQSITTEVQNTKTSAIDSIESTQSQSESQISTIRDEMTAQASDLTAVFNDSMNKLTSKQDTALAEVDSAKQAAITALEDFQNVDTSNWQKHKLTDDNGNQITKFNGDYPMTNENLLSAKTGFHYNYKYQDAPSGATGYVFIQENAGGSKKIYYSSYNKNDLYIKTYHNSIGWQDWKELTGDDGKAETISLADDYDKLHALDSGFHYTTSTPIDLPVSSTAGFTEVSIISDNDNLKRIEFRPYNSNQVFIKRFYETWGDWEPADGTNVELFSGSLTEMNKNISLKDDPRKYSFLIIELNQIGGDDTAFVRFRRDYAVIRTHNLGNSGVKATLIETDMRLDSTDPTKIYVGNSVRIESETATGEEYVPEILKIVGVK